MRDRKTRGYDAESNRLRQRKARVRRIEEILRAADPELVEGQDIVAQIITEWRTEHGLEVSRRTVTDDLSGFRKPPFQMVRQGRRSFYGYCPGGAPRE